MDVCAWNSNLSDKIKHNFFQALAVSILLYGCTRRTLMKHIEEKLDGNCTRMLQAILNISWKQQLFSHLPPISKTIQIGWKKHAEHCWRNKDELISGVLLWTTSHGCGSDAWPRRTYLQKLCVNTRCSLEDLLVVMDRW